MVSLELKGGKAVLQHLAPLEVRPGNSEPFGNSRTSEDRPIGTLVGLFWKRLDGVDQQSGIRLSFLLADGGGNILVLAPPATDDVYRRPVAGESKPEVFSVS